VRGGPNQRKSHPALKPIDKKLVAFYKEIKAVNDEVHGAIEDDIYHYANAGTLREQRKELKAKIDRETDADVKKLFENKLNIIQETLDNHNKVSNDQIDLLSKHFEKLKKNKKQDFVGQTMGSQTIKLLNRVHSGTFDFNDHKSYQDYSKLDSYLDLYDTDAATELRAPITAAKILRDSFGV